MADINWIAFGAGLATGLFVIMPLTRVAVARWGKRWGLAAWLAMTTAFGAAAWVVAEISQRIG